LYQQKQKDMNTLNTIEEVRQVVNNNNYYFKGNEFNSYSELESAAEEHFKSITEDSDDQEGYYNHFGLNVGEAHVDKVKVDKFYVEEVGDVVTVDFYESYIDSGVNQEDYFHGFIISY